MPSSPIDPHTTPDLTASPVRPRLRPGGVPGQTLDDCVPRPPIFDGDAVSEPAATASPHCVPDTAVDQVNAMANRGQIRLCRQTRPLDEHDAQLILDFANLLGSRAGGRS